MNENRREIMENVYLTYLPATKFKTGCLSAQLVTPLRRETAAWNALLPPGAQPRHGALSRHEESVRRHGPALRHEPQHDDPQAR